MNRKGLRNKIPREPLILSTEDTKGMKRGRVHPFAFSVPAFLFVSLVTFVDFSPLYSALP